MAADAADAETAGYAAAMDEAIAAAAAAEAKAARLEAEVARLRDELAEVKRHSYYHPEETRTVHAFYRSDFDVPGARNIQEAHRYEVKWDKLRIWWEEGQDPVEVEASWGADDTDYFKRPLTLGN